MTVASSSPVQALAAPPVHVAIIMDGNRRWAEARGLPRSLGHRQGAEAVRRAVSSAIELGISYLTLYVFSSENWKRPKDEVSDLMGLLRLYLRNEISTLRSNGVRIRMIGDRSRLAPEIVALITDAEESTAQNNRLTMTVALSYGSRDEIVRATRLISEQVRAGLLDPDDVTEDLFERYLGTHGIPDPDVIIRTAGEQRLSNFLLWQSAYSEFIFVNKLWPDFDKEDLANVISEYQKRERRYGARLG
ncbi:MAG: isoprenyl transferase [Alphaproteobacteria bacterium]